MNFILQSVKALPSRRGGDGWVSVAAHDVFSAVIPCVLASGPSSARQRVFRCLH